jgi:hypothetical protein
MTPQHTATTAPDSRAAVHDRQRDLVRASLIACPAKGRPTHRRWA